MDATEKFYRAWIRKIAKRTSLFGIKQHIVHHAEEIMGPSSNREAWLASMYNLLQIYEEKINVHSSTPKKLYRLGNRYLEKSKATPPPGGMIPANVKIKFNPAFDDAPQYRKKGAIKTLRKIGRK